MNGARKGKEDKEDLARSHKVLGLCVPIPAWLPAMEFTAGVHCPCVPDRQNEVSVRLLQIACGLLTDPTFVGNQPLGAFTSTLQKGHFRCFFQTRKFLSAAGMCFSAHIITASIDKANSHLEGLILGAKSLL